MDANTPNAWVIIKIQQPEAEPIYKVLAGWYGGYLDGDEWRMNSGITKIEDGGEYWDIHGYSGSVYRCYKNIERFTGFMYDVFASYVARLEGKAEMTHVEMKDVITLPEFSG